MGGIPDQAANNDVNDDYMEPYKVGDIVTMGWQRRTFIAWLLNKPPISQKYKVITSNPAPGGISYLEKV